MKLSNDFVNYSVSEGTLKMSDTIPKMVEFLSEHAKDEAAEFFRDWPQMDPDYPMPLKNQIMNMENGDVYQLDRLDMIYEELLDVMNAIAPELCYFGSHPGDGANIGFWQISDEYIF